MAKLIQKQLSPPWKTVPAVWLFFSFVVGILINLSFDASNPFAPWVWIGIVILSSAGGIWYLRTGKKLISARAINRTLLIYLAFAGLGALRYNLSQTLPENHVSNLIPLQADQSQETQQNFVLEGLIEAFPAEKDDVQRFILAVDRGFLPKSNDSTSVADTFSVSGLLQVSLYIPRKWSVADSGRYWPVFNAGDRLQINSRISAPAGQRNPADFDYKSYLRRQGIYARTSAFDSLQVKRLDQQITWQGKIISPVRNKIKTIIRQALPESESQAILTALLLADKSGLSSDLRDQFSRTGLAHLLAISGLHVMMLGMILYQLLKPILIRFGFNWQKMEWIRLTATTLVLLFYMIMVGGGASVVRAVLMAFLMMLGTALQRTYRPINSLAVAGVILLAIDPQNIFGAGFQLSFSAVGAILLIYPTLKSFIPEKWMRMPTVKWVLDMMLISTAATLGTLPVMVYHFGQIPLAGVLLNIFAIPITAAFLISGVLTVITGTISSTLAGFSGWFSSKMGVILVLVAEKGDQFLDFMLFEVYTDELWILAGMIFFLLTLTGFTYPRYRWRLFLLTVFCFAGGQIQNWQKSSETIPFEIIFFDVGQGDAALISLPNGKHVLIDAGLRDERFDSGERIILPHLKRNNIKQLDAVIISHPHTDHFGGLPSLIKAGVVKRFIHNGQPAESYTYHEIMQLSDSLNVQEDIRLAGDTLIIDPSVNIQILAPKTIPNLDDEPNNESLVVRIQYGSQVFMFAGDAEMEAEEWLTSTFDHHLKSDLIKVGHHGSRTSSSIEWVNKIAGGDSSLIAIVSVAKRNRYRLPNEEILERWKSAGATVLETRKENAIIIRSDGTTIERIIW